VKKALNITADILLAITVVIALAVLALNLFGGRTLAVLSGSMEPNYPVGSLVFAVPTPPEEIISGDAISYVINNQGTTVTHRVIEADREARHFITQGDANNAPDGNPVLYENVIGVVRFHVPMLGYALSFVLTTSGKIIAGTIVVALILLTILLGGKDKEKEEPKNNKEKITNEEILKSLNRNS